MNKDRHKITKLKKWAQLMNTDHLFFVKNISDTRSCCSVKDEGCRQQIHVVTIN